MIVSVHLDLKGLAFVFSWPQAQLNNLYFKSLIKSHFALRPATARQYRSFFTEHFYVVRKTDWLQFEINGAGVFSPVTFSHSSDQQFSAVVQDLHPVILVDFHWPRAEESPIPRPSNHGRT